jgi:hypothetical protein
MWRLLNSLLNNLLKLFDMKGFFIVVKDKAQSSYKSHQ